MAEADRGASGRMLAPKTVRAVLGLLLLLVLLRLASALAWLLRSGSALLSSQLLAGLLLMLGLAAALFAGLRALSASIRRGGG